jgi:hypothetical protein
MMGIADPGEATPVEMGIKGEYGGYVVTMGIGRRRRGTVRRWTSEMRLSPSRRWGEI